MRRSDLCMRCRGLTWRCVKKMASQGLQELASLLPGGTYITFTVRYMPFLAGWARSTTLAQLVLFGTSSNWCYCSCCCSCSQCFAYPGRKSNFRCGLLHGSGHCSGVRVAMSMLACRHCPSAALLLPLLTLPLPCPCHQVLAQLLP
jgi:hypothetical protein